MIILITGASHTGKTILAQKLLEKYRFPYFSVDHLKMGLIRSGNTSLTPEDDDKLTGYLWPIVREMIKTAIENKQSMIVEGCYVPFDWRSSFDDEYLADIRFICLAMTDSYIDSHFDDIVSNESVIEKRFVDTELTPASLKADNRAVVEGFFRFREKVTLIETDYNETITSLLAPVTAGERVVTEGSRPVMSSDDPVDHEAEARILRKFHKSRMITYGILAISVLFIFIGACVATQTAVVLIIGCAGIFASLLYGLFSDAYFCPFCNEPIGKQGFGTHCKYCGKEIF